MHGNNLHFFALLAAIIETLFAFQLIYGPNPIGLFMENSPGDSGMSNSPLRQ